ncbi:polysaccharide pyruvyl transferase family protein [Marinobacter pelagius]|uniref:polysaccharide pyruvyl transferase family protein n=1 Tax=Marinobacter sp. C7 TaxID=2951363 RepID=UPI001EF0DEF1|nr:polysaccharide pyruvyl transferase family protein [Marinobacter sp. C7]MCG7199117.1 polysaccharide pyruvyl transferase family protein [Marinobacter sp. C7]
MYSLIKKMLPLSVKREVVTALKRENVVLPDSRRAFIFLAADYGNIGDLAITAAQEEFIRSTLKNHALVRVPISRTRTQLSSIKNQINDTDLVTIIGGGNMGSLYLDIEELRQLVIRTFPNNRIVCFPQTLDWDDSYQSLQALERIVKVYSSHPDIHIFARESITRKKLVSLFAEFPNVKLGYAPDIVLSASGTVLGGNDESSPSGILRCLRNDKERSLDVERDRMLEEALASTGEAVEETDTHTGGARLSKEECAKLLASKVNQFRSARVVVTDRLHGMILSTLAGTPCLALPNANHKVRQTYLDWLSQHTRVAFIEPECFEELQETLDGLLLAPQGNPKISPLDPKLFSQLQKALTAS